MDRNYLGMIAAVTFLLVIITVSIKVQMSAIEEAANISNQRLSAELRTEAAALHVLNHERTEEFGTYNQSGWNHVTNSCAKGKVSGFEDDTYLRLRSGYLPCNIIDMGKTNIGIERKTSGGVNSEAARISWAFLPW